MSVQTRLVLSTICVFNAIILTALGMGSAVYIDGALRFVVGAGMWVAAAILLRISRWLRRGVEWR
jgi:hypothetical protein